MQSLPLYFERLRQLEKEGTELKFRLPIAAGCILLTIIVFFLRFYTFPDVKTVSGNDDILPCGYVPYADFYLYIDMDGKVLSVTNNTDDNLPVIEGIKYDQFVVGDYLKVNGEVFRTVAKLTNLLEKYDCDEIFIYKIDVANLSDIHLYIKNVDVAFGSTHQADEKIRTLKEIMSNLHAAEDIMGILDIRVIGRQYIFTVLT